MPLVRPFHKGIRFIAIPFLGFADKLFVIAFNVFQVVIGKLAVFRFEFPLKLHPFSLELLCIHTGFLLCLAISISVYISICPGTSKPPPYQPL